MGFTGAKAKAKPGAHGEVPNPSHFCYLISAGVLSSVEGSSIPEGCKVALRHSCTFLTIGSAEHGKSFLSNSNPHGLMLSKAPMQPLTTMGQVALIQHSYNHSNPNQSGILWLGAVEASRSDESNPSVHCLWLHHPLGILHKSWMMRRITEILPQILPTMSTLG